MKSAKNAKEDKSFGVKITGATLNWAKLNPKKPVSPFGTPQWELQIETTDKKEADSWIKQYLIVKEKDGVFTSGLKRKTAKFDGTPQAPVNVVDGLKNPIDMTQISIGNGSVGNVLLWVYPWETAGKSGWASSLSGVQVTKLIEYNGGDDFDVEGPTEGLDTTASGQSAVSSYLNDQIPDVTADVEEITEIDFH